ncbi:bacterio-opsin activator [Halostella sp. JP-L12]|uniref:helix-turn-helix domain-containing protein n=1 Tax=Halostella TaxID=1843185 RepID=UPI000EF759AB|nr:MULTISPECIES: helix-turn-helix domain-containing protein [Halostella]NHN49191.1 bacterio-opsin activator [Halostella sp. JP-L12]
MSYTVEESGTGADVGPLDVRLAIDADTATGCPLSGRDVDGVRQSMTNGDAGEDETCQVAVDDAEAHGYCRTPVTETCPCAVFDEHDCISDLEAVRDGRLLFSIIVPGRETLRSLVDDLRSIGASVSLERIRADDAEDDAVSDGVVLTPKQREVLSLAIESGYYDRPRGASLDDLADELDVTPSAVSQRLNAIERKLVCERAREFDLR